MADDPEPFKGWLRGGLEDLGKPAVEELLWDWLAPFLTKDERDRLIGWHWGGESLVLQARGDLYFRCELRLSSNFWLQLIST